MGEIKVFKVNFHNNLSTYFGGQSLTGEILMIKKSRTLMASFLNKIKYDTRKNGGTLHIDGSRAIYCKASVLEVPNE